MVRLIRAAHLVGAGHPAGPGWVAFEGGRVKATGTGSPDRTPDVDLSHGVLCPGLVDAQLNGAFGSDFASAGPDAWTDILTRLPTTGVTSVVPTFTTAPLPDLCRNLRAYATLRPILDQQAHLTRTLGTHIEGPFISARRRGAHPVEQLLTPTRAHIEAILESGADGALAYLTLAPELDHAMDAIRSLRAAGVRVAVGHSDASDDVVYAAVDAGATLITHLYNAQRPFHHRDPGVVGAALADSRLTVGLIVDGHHVDTTAVRVAFAAAGRRIMLVTDAVAALGMAAGTYVLGGRRLTVAAGEPPRRADGAIAGSAVRLDEAIANTVAAGVDVETAIRAATQVPADALGRPDLGRLSQGSHADCTWLAHSGPGNPLRAHATWISGELVYGADNLQRAH